MTDDPNRMPTDAEMNSATFWIVSQVYERPDITAELLDELAATGKMPMLWRIAFMLNVPLGDLVEKFVAEVRRRTGIAIAPVAMVPLATDKDTVH